MNAELPDEPQFRLYDGLVTQGHQMASGQSVGTPDNWFPAGTLALQQPHFLSRGFDFEAWVPNLYWGTINLEIGRPLILRRPDLTLELVDWTRELPATDRIEPETFSFVRCCLGHVGRYYPGLLYYPHPETKPPIVRHRYDVLEVLTTRVADLAPGEPASVLCRNDAFADRELARA